MFAEDRTLRDSSGQGAAGLRRLGLNGYPSCGARRIGARVGTGSDVKKSTIWEGLPFAGRLLVGLGAADQDPEAIGNLLYVGNVQ